MRYALVFIALAACAAPEPTPRPRVGVTVVTPSPVRTDGDPEIHFSPGGGCEAAVIRYIDAATTSIYVQAYSFTSKPIGDALIAAHGRGLQVHILLDKSDVTGTKTELADFESAHVPTLIDSKHAIAHNKVMIFDMKIVETGSFNYTKAAEHSNAENCIFLPSPATAAVYFANWQAHEAHSTLRPMVPSP
jgi:phosphatidylserine/phosphatidylglycerophosphate/cardiolipin synthase-like enzyme